MAALPFLTARRYPQASCVRGGTAGCRRNERSAARGLIRLDAQVIGGRLARLARNALTASSAPEVAPFPAGLNDCVSGLKWVAEHAGELGIDATRIIVAGESGGGNLTLAVGLKLKQDGELGLIRGLYALCPYVAGSWPRDDLPSSVENEGILLNLHRDQGALAYGIDAFESGNPLAWPGFASEDDVRDLVPTMISVNECDPLRDEGILFFRLLLRAGVAAQCRQVMGTIHGTEIFPLACPEISRETAASIAHFCRDVSAA
jgi:acetyl esterase/lipase